MIRRRAGPPRPWLIFVANRCPACEQLRALLTEVAPEAPVTLVDIDADIDLVEQHGVTTVPTLIRFAGDQVVDRIVGLPSRNRLRGWLRR